MKNQNMLLTILSLLPNQEFLGAIKFNKTLFLIQEKFPELLNYSWYRWDYGPFDSQIYKDLKSLEIQNLIQVNYSNNQKTYRLSSQGQNKLTTLSLNETEELTKLVNKINEMNIKNLLSMIYHKYHIFEYEMGDPIYFKKTEVNNVLK